MAGDHGHGPLKIDSAFQQYDHRFKTILDRFVLKGKAARLLFWIVGAVPTLIAYAAWKGENAFDFKGKRRTQLILTEYVPPKV